MQVDLLTVDQREEWNALARREPSFALMQSWEWGEFKEKLGWKAFRLAVWDQGQMIAGAQLLIKPLMVGAVSIAYIPRGPIGRWLEEPAIFHLMDGLHKVARQHRAIFLKIEPTLLNTPVNDPLLRKFHFHPSVFTNQPRATIIVDLKQDLDGLFKLVRKRSRDYIKSSARKGVTIRRGEQSDLPTFYKLMRITSRREHFALRAYVYYEQEWQTFRTNQQSVLLIADYEGQPLALHMAYRFGDHAAYFHGGSSNDHAELRPNHLLVWEAIKWAKDQGCHTYDLWGIPEEVGLTVSSGNEPPVSERTDALWGVYRFKSGFSKNIVCYISAHDYVYNPLLYILIQNRLVNPDVFERLSMITDLFLRT